MRAMLQQAALGLAMSAGTLAVCLVPSHQQSGEGAKDKAHEGLAMCPIPREGRPPIDVTARPEELPSGGARREKDKDAPSLRRLRQSEDAARGLRDDRDLRGRDDELDDEPVRYPSRGAREASRGRGASGRYLPLVSGLESVSSGGQVDPRVMRVVRHFTDSGEGRDTFAASLRRSGRYEEQILRVLDDHKLPRGLMAVALVESGFSATAVSPAGAAGLWQFMPGTARAYGLRVEPGFDERLAVARATVAAAEHLADLHEQLRSWELALAAYNMGYNGLVAKLEEHRTNDFWDLAEKPGVLPAETAQYVPRVLAAATVLANLDLFGLDTVTRADPLAAADLLVGPGFPVHVIARAAGLPVRDFRALNPQLLGSATPRGNEGVVVHVPPKAVDRTRALLARIERGEVDPDDLERPREEGRELAYGERANVGFPRARLEDDRDDGRDRDRDRDGFGGRGYGGRERDVYGGRERDVYGGRERDVYGGRDRDYRDRDPYAGRDPYRERDRDPHAGREAYRDREPFRYPRELPRMRLRAEAEADVVVPPGTPRRTASLAKGAAPSSARDSRSTVYYRVNDGDTAQTVAKTFGMTPDDVCVQNGLAPSCSTFDRGTLLELRIPKKAVEKLAHGG